MSLFRLSDDDWSDLLPGKDFTIGKNTIVIEPLGIAQLGLAMTKMGGLIKKLTSKGITPDTFNLPENIPVIFGELLAEAPGLFEKAAGIHRDDIARLPIGKGIELLKTVIDVNVESQDSLAKNLTALVEMVTGSMGAIGE